MNKSSAPTAFALFLSALIIVLAFVGVLEPSEFKADTSVETFTTLLLSLIAIALFIERSAEVYLSVWRRPKREQLARAVTKLKKEIEKREKALAELTLGTPPADAMATKIDGLAAPLSKAMEDLADHRAVTASYSLSINVSLGLLVACVGARGLEPLLLNTEPTSAFFVAVDILITGALLGGGADGLHKIVSVFTTWAEETKKRTQNTD
ncbi:hypothetical protein QMT40_000307 [Parvibaculaceae bacterium PLY_AMNH_Bact1]|nr:hypothetical protein QMT40_000307 [Parvibaculaceae bacterium PLY_AMNH_Bact1]